MGIMFYDYEFNSAKYQNAWECILKHRFESMELYYRKQFSMSRLLSHFKKAFKIAPITIKNSTEKALYKHKTLAIYLLTKYSKDEFKVISKGFHISLETIKQISSNSTYRTTFQDEIKLFFKQFEDDFLMERKSSLAFQESIEKALR